MKNPKYVIGIDLGTTNCVVAYAPLEDKKPEIKIFNVLQITAPNEMRALPQLPSFVYLLGGHDINPSSVRLPWQESPRNVVGHFARKRGSEVPHRLVSSAKSWLCHSGVDRTKPILPWGSPEEVEKISPVVASSLLLAHLRDAWNHSMASEDPSSRFEYQDIYITVPASFDAVARELTVKAAKMAGLEEFTLLEEPQAAFYAWIDAHGENWRNKVKVGDCILVCDIGGGTTDFSLIEVAEEDGTLTLKRVAVGEHILLGGDNMDLALAYALRQKIASRLDDWQFRALWYQARAAKERLLSRPEARSEPVVIFGRGTGIVGGTIKTELHKEEVEKILVDGFFPKCSFEEAPVRTARIGVREMGLPYEEDPGVTRHLASFLRRHIDRVAGFPTAVLFNGGVMKAEVLRSRVVDTMREWSGGEIRELAYSDLDLAVARGAAYYGLVRRGAGIRIRAGASRSYYIAIERAMPAVPGVPTPTKALCVVPFGMEEGTSAEIREKEFGLVVGQPAVFRLFSSTSRQVDRIGEMIEDWEGAMEPTAIMETILPASEEEEGGTVVPVWLESAMTEIGTLELRCVDVLRPERKWKLEFNLKERASGEASETSSVGHNEYERV
ncbi:Hsp70 family protein [Thermodesulforhabdus norvegica]|uniref:Molecular chaperone DnaK (HSP70) n=1 Tax=Thermodesulforhabdus norvegica TaxID=39841 RepID=A0A1I4STA8_9BACT|nr:Hsp70 family protein [Thermodesulforhabdus norvegica]SFM67609.1 Molecular chaperone DnaK (HSP70) [Thermodesulforhabdus norvegica]